MSKSESGGFLQPKADIEIIVSNLREVEEDMGINIADLIRAIAEDSQDELPSELSLDRLELYSAYIHTLVEILHSNQYRAVVYIDRGARNACHGVMQLWNKLYPNMDQPKPLFLNPFGLITTDMIKRIEDKAKQSFFHWLFGKQVVDIELQQGLLGKFMLHCNDQDAILERPVKDSVMMQELRSSLTSRDIKSTDKVLVVDTCYTLW
jgi:hypothetical protein